MEEYWEWLCSVPSLSLAQKEMLLRCFGTPQAIWEASGEELAYLEERGCSWIARVRKLQRELTPEKTVHMHREQGIQFISHEHTRYPKRLRNITGRPYGLFYRGELPEEEKKSVAIVGARMCTRAGKEMAELLAQRIARAGGQVISGAAYGIDGAAQWAALERGGRSYAVLGCGVDLHYPQSNRRLFERLAESGGILSEFPPGTPPMRQNFPVRNRIISGLADVVVVAEARLRSGSLITADFAAEQGRTVMAVPGRPGDEMSAGCNLLISQGADIILSVDSFEKTVFSKIKNTKNQLSDDLTLAPAEKLVYSSLDFHARSVWELEEQTKLSLAELGSSLLTLEMKGLAKETQHNYYMRAL